MDSSSRRAFALDSRTVWVEQQLVHQNKSIVAKDNLVVGPGEYNVRIPERHVSTPVLGKYGGHFNPFVSNLSVRTPLSNSGIDRPFSRGAPSPKSASYPKRDTSIDREYNTTNHDHSTRQPFAPNGSTPTPGPYIGPEKVDRKVMYDGVHEVKQTVPFGRNDIPFGERCPTKPAGQTYDIKYDSLQVRPTPKYGTFPIQKRIYIPSNEQKKKKGKKKRKSKKAEVEKDNREINGADSAGEDDIHAAPSEQVQETSEPLLMQQSSLAESSWGVRERSAQSPNSRRPRNRLPNQAFNQGDLRGHSSLFEARCNSVPMPKLKYRALPTLTFDDSSYTKTGKGKELKKPIDLTPKLVNKEARINLFEKYVAIPRPHVSKSFSSTFV